ncbi:MAG TPA: hypothetical protein ENI48_03355 [Thioploca sp.]|nr:hypothetical protein [Thioploca sp.]
MRRIYLVITLIFLFLAIALQTLMFFYWHTVLEPRLWNEADSHAKLLAHAQAGVLAKALVSGNEEQRRQALIESIAQILLFTDPTTGLTFFSGITLEVDYDVVLVPVSCLDLERGVTDCKPCFSADVALYDPDTDELLGIAGFQINDRFYQLLSKDVKIQLFTESSIGLILLAVVWLLVIILFKKLHQAKERSERANLAKIRSLANMSHEIRTPLNAILGYAQLFKDDQELMRTHGQAIETIYRSGEHLLLMINDILDIAKIDAGKLELLSFDIHLPTFLNTLADMARIRAQLKDIQFIYTAPTDFPTAVHGDEKHLRQILLNLLSNAIKFTPDGTVHFQVQKLSAENRDNQQWQKLRFQVTDTGFGIPHDKWDEILLPFHQLIERHQTIEGTGLGLAITSRLLNLMGSKLCIKSQVDKGSTFWFDLELPAVNEVVNEQTSPHRRVTGYRGSRRKLLVIDDNNSIYVEFVRVYCRNSGNWCDWLGQARHRVTAGFGFIGYHHA